jgi:hypothetical protein
MMTNQASVQVYVGNYGTYPVSPSFLLAATEANAGKRLDDLRTRGAKMIADWGRTQDEAARLAMARAKGAN